MDITPQKVIDVLVGAGVKRWMVIGPHGYASYLPYPRATQDVEIMMPQNQRYRAVEAVCDTWPELQARNYLEAVRFGAGDAKSRHVREQSPITITLSWQRFIASCLRTLPSSIERRSIEFPAWKRPWH
jgi:hypothetical protein